MISAIGSTVYNSYCCAPVRWICDKITKVAEAIFGYLLRITTFQMGEFKTFGAYVIIRIFQLLSSDPREEKPFDRNRLEESKQLLIRFGGVENFVNSADGSRIHCMTFKSADFFNAFIQRGARLTDILYQGRPRKVFLNLPPEAKKFRLPIIEVETHDDVLIKCALLPESPPGNGKLRAILQTHSPGRSMFMDREFLWRHLLAGYDVAIYDPPGTVDSTGTASEGSYYLAAEAVFQHLLNLGYQPNRIYASGFCEGAAVAAHLKKRFHHLGINFIGANPYTSMKDVLEGYGWLGRLGIRFGLSSLKNPSLAVEQDGFDNVNKFRNLPRSEGRFVFIDTDTDKMMPANTVQKLSDTIGNAGPIFHHRRIHPNPKVNGHMQPPYEDPNVWRRYVELVT